MANSLIKYAFTAGVLAQTAHGRTDLEKYDLGLAEGENYFVDYKGGISNRTGSVFGDFVFEPEHPTRLFTFKYSPDIADTFLVLFGNGYIRFIQDNAYVLEAAKTVTAVTRTAPGVFTCAGHGFTSGDVLRLYDFTGMIELNKRSFKVNVLSSNTFSLIDPFGEPVDTSDYGTFVSGKAARVLTLVSPYDPDDLADLAAKQNKNTIKFTSVKYHPKNLTRAQDGTWSIANAVISSNQAPPSGLVGTPSAAGTAGIAWGVTSVGFDGEESRVSSVLLEETSVNYTATAGSYTLSWSPVAGTAYYNVYRSNVLADGSKITKGAQLGYVGRSFGTDFTDSNIVPNFAITPPEHYDPFNIAGVSYIDVSNGGTGYSKSDTVTVTGGGGSGFEGYLVVNSSGSISAVVVTFPGSGYSSPVITITTSGGSGFAGTVTLNPASGTYPAQNAIFQKRQIYASSLNQPLTLWGSRPSKLNNFDVSRVAVDNDSYEFDLEVEQVSAISHIIATRGGMLLMSQTGVWLLSGASGGPVTPNSALAEPQSYFGVSKVPPLRIDTEILYNEGKGSTVRMLSYNDFSKVYGGVDVSILSSHFFGAGKELVSWDFAQEPHKLVTAVRRDGKMLMFTIVPEQKVFGWTDASTRGKFLDIAVVSENRIDYSYVVTERKINGKVVNFFERFAQRDYVHEEESIFLDAALTLPTNPITAATLTAAASTGTGVLFTASAAVFSSGDVGKIIRSGGGKALVTEYLSPTQVKCTIQRAITQVEFQTPNAIPQVVKAGDWYLDAEFSYVTGLWHLEGMSVRVLADGSVLPDVVVTNGRIELETSASRIIVGLPYRSVARTLPLTSTQGVIESKRKRVVGTAVHMFESRGLKCGTSLDNLYPFEERTNEAYGAPTEKQSGFSYMMLDTTFDDNGQTYYVQDEPLPVSILGFVLDVDIGDENN
jgi:Ubiquitin-activating enzyme E1 FCCH domain